MKTRREIKDAYVQREVRFCELLAEGHSTAEIRAAMSLTNGAFQGMLARVRKQLGWQAI